jgi:type III pantothenate kinase
MLLVIDIGNTSIKFAFMTKQKIVGIFHLATAQEGSGLSKRAKKLLRVLSSGRAHNIDGVIICSVVPKALKILEPLLRREFQKPVIVVGRDEVVPIRNLYRNPRQVGQDRLVGAFAAWKIYGVPVLIIDLGTAITIDVVSRRGEYEGGVIIPGLRLSVESLNQKTALLPKVTIHKPRTVIGKDTQESILSGIFYGYGEMLTGLIKRISGQLKIKPKVVLTGGNAELMKKYIGYSSCVIDKNITFKGLTAIWEFRQAKER